MYNEQEEILSRVSESEKDRLKFEAENFSLQPRRTWWEWEEYLDAASTFEFPEEFLVEHNIPHGPSKQKWATDSPHNQK